MGQSLHTLRGFEGLGQEDFKSNVLSSKPQVPNFKPDVLDPKLNVLGIKSQVLGLKPSVSSLKPHVLTPKAQVVGLKPNLLGHS